jgi:hypothetical protein
MKVQSIGIGIWLRDWSASRSTRPNEAVVATQARSAPRWTDPSIAGEFLPRPTQ